MLSYSTHSLRKKHFGCIKYKDMDQIGGNPKKDNVIRSREKRIKFCAVGKGEIICSNIAVSILIYKCLMKEQCNNPSDKQHEIERGKYKIMSGRVGL